MCRPVELSRKKTLSFGERCRRRSIVLVSSAMRNAGGLFPTAAVVTEHDASLPARTDVALHSRYSESNSFVCVDFASQWKADAMTEPSVSRRVVLCQHSRAT